MSTGDGGDRGGDKDVDVVVVVVVVLVVVVVVVVVAFVGVLRPLLVSEMVPFSWPYYLGINSHSSLHLDPWMESGGLFSGMGVRCFDMMI